MKRLLTISLLALASAVSVSAEAPTNYYQPCAGKSGESLVSALHNIINSHTTLGYGAIWTAYRTTDTDAQGKVMDMYSTKRWTYGSEQCGTYGRIGDCYNREHSLPKSWFNDASPMYTDLHHLVPTDGFVNNQRSNHPFGECANGTSVSSYNGIDPLGKLGKSTRSGYSGTVFEPDDQYKGDFARIYFYMATCYYDRIRNWNSDMLNSTSYPAFTTWALDMLLEWHRNDPVDIKEINRNDAVYALQGNRNPFVDNPEMVEYAWGNMKNERWQPGEAAVGQILVPADGSIVDLGSVVANATKSTTICVKGEYITSNLTLTASGSGFSVTPTTLSASQVNAESGTDVRVSFSGKSGGSYTGTLTVKRGSTVLTTVTLKAKVVTGLTALPATNITATSFAANWVNVGDADSNGRYTLHVQDMESAETKTYAVAATAEAYPVENLNPESEYRYWLTSQTLTSNFVDVRTGVLYPAIAVSSDGCLHIEAMLRGESPVREIWLNTENIIYDMIVEVSHPFEISSDHSTWSDALRLDPDEDRFYLRVDTEEAGEYSTTLKIAAGNYINDETVVTATVIDSSTMEFVEDFEEDITGCSTYNGCTYKGRYAEWFLSDAGIWASDKNYAHSGRQAVRMGKTANSSITMMTDKTHGIGTITLYARRWSDSEGDCTMRLDYSTDDGQTWIEGESMTVSTTTHTLYSININEPNARRIRIQQTAGKRFIIDDISIGNYLSTTETIDQYHSWDAYCRDGSLTVSSTMVQSVRIYGVDGIVYYDEAIAPGEKHFDLPIGLYVVAVGNDTRRVLVK